MINPEANKAVNDRPSPIDTIDPSTDWGLVLFAIIFIAVGTWIVWKYADDAKK